MLMLFSFENAFYDTASIYDFADTNQYDYVREVLEALSVTMPSFKNFRFYFFCATAGIGRPVGDGTLRAGDGSV